MINLNKINEALVQANKAPLVDIVNVNTKNILADNGYSAPNQFILSVTDSKGNTVQIYQSYKTNIALLCDGSYILTHGAIHFSNTTLKYLKVFLKTTATKSTIAKYIQNNVYTIVELN